MRFVAGIVCGLALIAGCDRGLLQGVQEVVTGDHPAVREGESYDVPLRVRVDFFRPDDTNIYVVGGLSDASLSLSNRFWYVDGSPVERETAGSLVDWDRFACTTSGDVVSTVDVVMTIEAREGDAEAGAWSVRASAETGLSFDDGESIDLEVVEP